MAVKKVSEIWTGLEKINHVYRSAHRGAFTASGLLKRFAVLLMSFDLQMTRQSESEPRGNKRVCPFLPKVQTQRWTLNVFYFSFSVSAVPECSESTALTPWYLSAESSVRLAVMFCGWCEAFSSRRHWKLKTERDTNTLSASPVMIPESKHAPKTDFTASNQRAVAEKPPGPKYENL